LRLPFLVFSGIVFVTLPTGLSMLFGATATTAAPIRLIRVRTLIVSHGATVGFFAAFTTDLGHMFAIGTHGFPTFATGFSGFLGSKLMCSSLLVCRAPAFTGNLTLPFLIHRCETAIRSIFLFLRHVTNLKMLILNGCDFSRHPTFSTFKFRTAVRKAQSETNPMCRRCFAFTHLDCIFEIKKRKNISWKLSSTAGCCC
jgi:hypothetical protein